MTDHKNFSGYSFREEALRKEIAELKLENAILKRAMELQQNERALDCIEYYIDNARQDIEESTDGQS